MKPTLFVLLLWACGGSTPFSFHDRDSRGAELAAVAVRVAAARAPAAAAPVAYLVTRDATPSVVAWDLNAGRALWEVPANVQSKLTLGGDLLAYVDTDGFLVARDRASGKQRFRYSLGGSTLIGAAAGSRDVFVVTRTGDDLYQLDAWDGQSGKTRWSHEARGRLGAPVVAAGLVAVPHVSQWLAFFEESSGAPVARLRSADEEIHFVKASGGNIYFGSKKHVRRVDENAASAQLADATSGAVTIPPPLARAAYDRDAFDPVQANYSAYDRTRILWRAKTDGGSLEFDGDRAVFVAERYLFAQGARDAKLAWAMMASAPIVYSEDTGTSILIATDDGIVAAVDKGSGAALIKQDVGHKLRGALFDAEGFAPSGGTAANENALSVIARDRDARFRGFQSYAVSALAALPGALPTIELLAILDDERADNGVKKSARAALVARKDKQSVPALLEALERRPSYLGGSHPQSVAAAAEALAALGLAAYTPAQAEEVKSALLASLEHPATDPEVLTTLIGAVQTLDARGNAPAVRAFLLTYRSDPTFDGDPAALNAAIDLLLATPDEWNREVVSFTAADPRTRPAVRDYARAALAR